MIDTYRTALVNALNMMNECDELEPTSALKQAASDEGIEYGDDMGEFIAWAYNELGFDA